MNTNMERKLNKRRRNRTEDEYEVLTITSVTMHTPFLLLLLI